MNSEAVLARSPVRRRVRPVTARQRRAPAPPSLTGSAARAAPVAYMHAVTRCIVSRPPARVQPLARTARQRRAGARREVRARDDYTQVVIFGKFA